MTVSCTLKESIDILRPSQGITDLSKAGFSSVMLDMGIYYSAWEFENLGKKMKSDIGNKAAISTWLDGIHKNEMRVSLVKAPQLLTDTSRSIGEEVEAKDLGLPSQDKMTIKEALLCLAKEGIRISEQAGAKYVLVQPLFAGVDKEDIWKVNKEFYLELANTCTKEETCILLANQCKNQNGHLVRGICSDAEEAVAWIEKLNQECKKRFGFCLDAGAATICGQDMQSMIRILQSHIKAVIIRDCDGYRESSMLPFTGVTGGAQTTDWLSLIRGLRDISFDEELVFDMSDTVKAFSPLLRPGLLALTKSVGDFFHWQITMEKTLQKYQSIVLFGAGNMCRNYMKCYGEKYPPLFTCDNNEKLWDTLFCGLEVKPPEALKDIPADCGVIICNIYYREIEQQLRNMGITNIGYFNDEYMPSFYSDRLKREG